MTAETTYTVVAKKWRQD